MSDAVNVVASGGGGGHEVIPTHMQATVAGLTFNLDTIWSTVFAGLVVLGLGFYMRARITHGVPGKLQLVWEAVVDDVQKRVDANLGPVAPFVVPLAVSLFFFILIANWIEVVPTMGYVPSPTADANLPYALALLVIVWAHATGVRKNGFLRYMKHFFRPYWWLFPINLIEEIAKPITLSLRLFGNLFAAAIMIALIATLFPTYVVPFPNAAWKLFDMFIGLIQAFIFALLTIIYFGFAVGSGEEH